MITVSAFLAIVAFMYVLLTFFVHAFRYGHVVGLEKGLASLFLVIVVYVLVRKHWKRLLFGKRKCEILPS